MALSMVTRDGVQLRGEAYVSSVSDGMDSAMVAVLAGSGPLRRV
jgi:NH3-dependent NAD+ synthetase